MKTSAMPTIIICWLLSLSLIFAEVRSSDLGAGDFSAEEMYRVSLREREIHEESTARYFKLLRDTATLRSQLVDGNFSGIDKAFARKDLRVLWFLFEQANGRSIGVGELRQKLGAKTPEFVASLETLNKQVSDYVRPKIAAIPGHAKAEGDRIEMMSQEAGYFNGRASVLRGLGKLGSMEAIQQIGRFLEDKRNPESGANLYRIDSGMGLTECNFESAAYAMVKALGEASPVKLSKILQLSYDDMLKLQAWWKSDAAKPYRDWTYETGQPMPPPRPRPVAALPPKAPAQMVPPSKSSPVLSAADEMRMERWLLWVVVGGGGWWWVSARQFCWLYEAERLEFGVVYQCR